MESSSALSVNWDQMADKTTPASKAELFLPVSHSARWPLEALVLQLSQPSSLCVTTHSVNKGASRAVSSQQLSSNSNQNLSQDSENIADGVTDVLVNSSTTDFCPALAQPWNRTELNPVNLRLKILIWRKSWLMS